MTSDEIRALMARMVEATNSHYPAAVAGFYATDGVLESPSIGLQRGRPQIQAATERWHSAFPDTVLRLDELLIENDHVAAYITIRATHRGEFLGLAPTGKQIEFRGVYLREFADRLVVRERRIYDFSGFLIELGVLKVRRA